MLVYSSILVLAVKEIALRKLDVFEKLRMRGSSAAGFSIKRHQPKVYRIGLGVTKG
jgi:hypothetical protein